ncbi:hypothetical protein Mal4_56820 [Maioricimonas rarisocia]|uniref:Uncharacterized protein n=1 Tax=Maioricimonas rarisocia TaxID=2528026 RepID=A0A517ZFQ9_9PLAN|nr:hypothetical protein Mal4_56820 [Maioricimonas rarisocia]
MTSERELKSLTTALHFGAGPLFVRCRTEEAVYYDTSPSVKARRIALLSSSP